MTFSVLSLSLIVVLMEEVKLFKLPLLVSNAFNLFSWFKSVVATLELNVLYPVVPVISICTLLEITLSLSNFDLIVVLMEEVKLFKLPLLVSNSFNLLSWFKSIVAFELDKIPTEELKLTTFELRLSILFEILELNVL